MMRILLYWGIIYLVWNMGLYIIRKLEKPVWEIQRKEHRILIWCSCINAAIITRIPCRNTMEELLFAVLGGCLLFACITDYKTCEVYQFTWWIAGAVGFWVLLRGNVMFKGAGISDLLTLLAYCLLQEIIFCRFYGRADCHAFVVCALVTYGIGMELRDCLIHMLFAFSGLAVVQALRQNISKKGNLKQPVAFLPYITVAFWVNLGCVFGSI